MENSKTSLHCMQLVVPSMFVVGKRPCWQMHWLTLVEPAALVVEPSGQAVQTMLPASLMDR